MSLGTKSKKKLFFKKLKGGAKMEKTICAYKNAKDKIVTLCDWHVPFEDKIVVEIQLQFCKHEQPPIIILHELHDFYAISRFDKDPKRISSLQSEIDKVNEYVKRLRDYCPKARIILLSSNHTDRLKKYLWRQAPGLHSLRSLQLKELLNLEELNIEYKETFTYKGVIFKHGNKIRKFSAYTAHMEFENEGMSGASGHTHRLGVYFTTVRGGKYVWIESGCGCKLNPEYMDGIPNWQNGFSIVAFDKKGKHFYPTVVPIIDHRADWGNITIDGNKQKPQLKTKRR